MRPSSGEWPEHAASPEQGSAVVEFVFLSALLMVPLVYFIITVGQIQGGSFAVVGAADQAAKVYVAQPDAASGRAAAEQAVLLALADYGQPAGNATRRHPLRACRLPGSRLGGDSHRPPHRAPAVCAVQRRTASEREPAQRVGNPTGGQVPVSGAPGRAARRPPAGGTGAGAEHRLHADCPAGRHRRHGGLQRLPRTQETALPRGRRLGGRRGQLHPRPAGQLPAAHRPPSSAGRGFAAPPSTIWAATARSTASAA